MIDHWPLFDPTGAAALISGDIVRIGGRLFLDIRDVTADTCIGSAQAVCMAARQQLLDVLRLAVSGADGGDDWRPSLSLLLAVDCANRFCVDLHECFDTATSQFCDATAHQIALDMATRDHAYSLHCGITGWKPGHLAAAMSVWAAYAGRPFPDGGVAPIFDISAARLRRNKPQLRVIQPEGNIPA